MAFITETATFTRFADGSVHILPSGVSGKERLSEDEADGLSDYLAATKAALADAQAEVLKGVKDFQATNGGAPTATKAEAKAEADKAALAVAGKDVEVVPPPTKEEQKAADDAAKAEEDAAKAAAKAEAKTEKSDAGA